MSYKGIKFNGKPLDVPKKLSEMIGDNEHRTVSDQQINSWDKKSDFSGNYSDLTGTPIIPSKTSQLENDSNFLTADDIPSGGGGGGVSVETDPTVPQYVKEITEQNIQDWNNKSSFSGSYEDLADKPDIPTKTSQLENDSNFITADNVRLRSSIYSSYNGLVVKDKDSVETGIFFKNEDFAVVSSGPIPNSYKEFRLKDVVRTNTDQDIDGNINFTKEVKRNGEDLVASSDIANVAKTGSYNDLSDKPEIPSIEGLATTQELENTASSTLDSAKEYTDEKFNGANKAVSFVNYSSMITSLNALSNTSYSVGQNIMIVTLQVPDLWINEVAEESVSYTYVSDDDFVADLNTNGSVQVGYYKLSALETQKVDLTDYVKNTDYATASKVGLIKANSSQGIFISASGDASLVQAQSNDLVNKTNKFRPLTANNMDEAFKASMTTNTQDWSDDDKTSARNLIDAVGVNDVPIEYDVIISNQTEFEDFYASLDDGTCTAESVLFIGNGGSAYFIREDGKGLRLPTSLKTISGKNNAKIRIDNFVYSSDSQAGIYYDTLNSSMDYKIQNLQVEVLSSTTNSICAKNCSNISNCAFYAYQYSSLYSYAVYCCNNLIDCIAYADTRANKNGVYAGTAYGVYETNNLTRCAFYAYGGTTVAGAEGGSNYYNCKSSVAGNSSNAKTYGYYYSSYLFGCTSEINSGNICRGFEICYYLFGCYSTIKVKGEYNYGYSQCSYPVTCLVHTSGTNYETKQYNNCYHINATIDDIPLNYVTTDSEQTISANKTFSGIVIVPDVTIT